MIDQLSVETGYASFSNALKSAYRKRGLMRPSLLWIATATALALAGLALQYPDIHGRRPLLADLQRELGYPPDAWWEVIVWPWAFFAGLTVVMMAWFMARSLLPQKKPSSIETSNRWKPPMEGD